MDEKFFPEYKKFIRFLEKTHKGKLDNTNNQIENYIVIQCHDHIKRNSEQLKEYSIR